MEISNACSSSFSTICKHSTSRTPLLRVLSCLQSESLSFFINNGFPTITANKVRQSLLAIRLKAPPTDYYNSNSARRLECWSLTDFWMKLRLQETHFHIIISSIIFLGGNNAPPPPIVGAPCFMFYLRRYNRACNEIE